MKIAICIDYDNLEKTQKTAGILNVVSAALIKLSDTFTTNRGTCEVRLYGGWFEGENLSSLSQTLSANIQSDFPTLIRTKLRDGSICILRATAELAFSLLEEPSHQLFNTYRRKGRPSNIRVETPSNVGCSSTSCPLPLAKKLLQKGSCPTEGCTSGGSPLIYRHEQKLVDTMLTCDLMYLSSKEYSKIILVSADDDFLPPIRTLALRGANIVRVHPTLSTNHQPIRIAGSQLMEVSL